uniref:Uncharacterized protein n=1 Tax=Lepeophtheirus salmonis TaxID=72036 RepID=A0A0K2TR10_LEPSM
MADFWSVSMGHTSSTDLKPLKFGVY